MKRTLLIAAALALLFTACNLPTSNAGPDMETVATLGVVTSAEPTEGQPPTLMPVPSLTPIPFAATPHPTLGPTIVVTSAGPRAQRIQFAQGGVSATIIGSVTAAQVTRYILYAFQGQKMYVDLSSPGDAANFAIRTVTNDQELKLITDPARAWSGILPASDDYYIIVAVDEGALDFKLTVTILWQ
jgi:hypothetical protein